MTSRSLEHSSTLRIRLACDPQAPSLARAAIAGFFDARDIEPGALATVTLLVSELVSNAVVHPDTPQSSEIVLVVLLANLGVVRVEVIDQGKGFIPVARDPGHLGGGYGLYLVDKQATRWGVDRHDGSRVWFELPSHGGEHARR